MKLNWLLERCGEPETTLRSPEGREREIHAVFSLPARDTLSEGALYVGTAGELGALPASGARLAFWLPEDARQAAAERRFPQADFVWGGSLPKEALQSLAQTRLFRERELYLREHAVFQSLLTEQDIHKVVQEAYAVLRNPIFILEPSRKRVAACWGGKPPEPGSFFARIQNGEPIMDSPQAAGHSLDALRRAEAELVRTHSPVVLYHADLGMDVMLAQVQVRQVEIFRATVVAHEHPFDDLDKVFLADFCALLSQLYQREGFYSRNRGQTAAYFLRELLSEAAPDTEALGRRLRSCGVRLLPCLRVMSVRIQDRAPLEPQALDTLAQQLHRYLPGHIYAILEDRIVFLLHFRETGDLDAGVLDCLGRVLQVNRARAGISNRFRELAAARDYAWQAEEALSAPPEPGRKEAAVTFFRDVSFSSMLSLCRTHMPLEELCDPRLLELIAADRRNRSCLAVTLYWYLSNCCSAPKTARQLYIHKNTMLSRLARIRQMLGVEELSGGDVFRLQLSYRILMYLGRFQPELDNPPNT